MIPRLSEKSGATRSNPTLKVDPENTNFLLRRARVLNIAPIASSRRGESEYVYIMPYSHFSFWNMVGVVTNFLIVHASGAKITPLDSS